MIMWFLLLLMVPCQADVMILTLPASGSEFLTHCMRDVYGCGKVQDRDKQHQSFNMQGEYFIVDWRKRPQDIFKDWDRQELVTWYNKYKSEGYTAAKEIHAFTRVPFFLEKFDCIFLFRHRKHTFPSMHSIKSSIYQKMYQGFMMYDYEHINEGLYNLQRYCEKYAWSDNLKESFIHTIAWYIQLKNYQNTTDKPALIMNYADLISFNEEQLQQELRCILPPYIERIAEISKNIVKHRNIILSEREERYKALQVEFDCQKLLEYMKRLDTEFKYWQLLA